MRLNGRHEREQHHESWTHGDDNGHGGSPPKNHGRDDQKKGEKEAFEAEFVPPHL